MAHFNLANVLTDQDRLEEALASYEQALALQPDFAQAHNNAGNILRILGQWQRSEIHYRQALCFDPPYADARYNLGMLKLHLGQWDEGWADYEWRHQVNQLLPRIFPQPRWDGASLAGKTILLQAEQGLGDTLQFIRYAPLVKERGGTVLVECQAALARIVSTCPGIDYVFTPEMPAPHFDVQAPLLSLPALFKTTPANVPAAVPYLKADPNPVEHWRNELAEDATLKVGIVWQGDPKFRFSAEVRAADRRRSIPLACFEPLARVPGVRLFSLQKGFGSEQLAQWQNPLGIVPLGDRLTDFMDTAAVMMNLDLIISADTSPLHLAGALGRPVWAVLPYSGCWRWLVSGDSSPWYPTMRLYRQQRPGDWRDVFERMAQGLNGSK